ncbi:MAG: hypothetical protein JW861_05220 [Bacteroidales bacterium]|nr:hypothetical protein [Bacteroidales bacterium]
MRFFRKHRNTEHVPERHSGEILKWDGRNAFTLPDRYFDRLPEAIRTRIEDGSPGKFPVFFSRVFTVPRLAAISLIVIIGLTWLIFRNGDASLPVLTNGSEAAWQVLVDDDPLFVGNLDEFTMISLIYGNEAVTVPEYSVPALTDDTSINGSDAMEYIIRQELYNNIEYEL